VYPSCAPYVSKVAPLSLIVATVSPLPFFSTSSMLSALDPTRLSNDALMEAMGWVRLNLISGMFNPSAVCVTFNLIVSI
jgi:hypothetical protein